MPQLEGKVAVVTGGGRGLGRAYCEALAREGAQVVAADIRDTAETVAAVAAAHGKGGLQLVDIGEDLGKYFGVDAGVLVLDVPPGSALKPGDILRRIDDADIGNAREAYRLLAELDAAGEATVPAMHEAVQWHQQDFCW